MFKLGSGLDLKYVNPSSLQAVFEYITFNKLRLTNNITFAYEGESIQYYVLNPILVEKHIRQSKSKGGVYYPELLNDIRTEDRLVEKTGWGA
ncbi:MAG: hypothetical protein HC836_43810 [Richelia sp. RM2_1_2]|nr:hypothetical protein [Richelia sp. RM2_1_2]